MNEATPTTETTSTEGTAAETTSQVSAESTSSVTGAFDNIGNTDGETETTTSTETATDNFTDAELKIPEQFMKDGEVDIEALNKSRLHWEKKARSKNEAGEQTEGASEPLTKEVAAENLSAAMKSEAIQEQFERLGLVLNDDLVSAYADKFTENGFQAPQIDVMADIYTDVLSTLGTPEPHYSDDEIIETVQGAWGDKAGENVQRMNTFLQNIPADISRTVNSNPTLFTWMFDNVVKDMAGPSFERGDSGNMTTVEDMKDELRSMLRSNKFGKDKAHDNKIDVLQNKLKQMGISNLD